MVAGLPASAWRRVTVAEGSQGPLVYEYAEVTAWFSEEGLPSGPERLLVRRSLGQEPELKYHRTNAPAEVALATAAGIRSKRWRVEKDQADYPSSRRWVGTRRIGYHRRDGVARAGRVVPATPGRTHRRSRMSDTTRRTAPPRA